MIRDVKLLLAEDNEGDIFFITEALQERNIITNITVARDGQQAIELLEKRGECGGIMDFDIVILDINLPKKNGHEVLKYIKDHKELKHIPVIMLSTSSSEIDIRRSYQSHANCFIIKPSDAEKFINVIENIENFWIKTVHLTT